MANPYSGRPTGMFITFEGGEGCGKSTQISLLADRLRHLNYEVVILREPGGTAIGEEIRHTLQHSHDNAAMAPETELLLMNASRAQLVREIIRPALDQGKVVLCDRFYDSTMAYQGYGRGLDLELVRFVVNVAVGSTRPDLTLLLQVSKEVSDQRLRDRYAATPQVRDRMEEADAAFFRRVEEGFLAVAGQEPHRIRPVNASGAREEVAQEIWGIVETVLKKLN